MGNKPLHDEIVTESIYPPIPDRSHDWCATFDWMDGDDNRRGFGETEREAVFDLIKNCSDSPTDETDDFFTSAAMEIWDQGQPVKAGSNG